MNKIPNYINCGYCGDSYQSDDPTLNILETHIAGDPFVAICYDCAEEEAEYYEKHSKSNRRTN